MDRGPEAEEVVDRPVVATRPPPRDVVDDDTGRLFVV